MFVKHEIKMFSSPTIAFSSGRYDGLQDLPAGIITDVLYPAGMGYFNFGNAFNGNFFRTQTRGIYQLSGQLNIFNEFPGQKTDFTLVDLSNGEEIIKSTGVSVEGPSSSTSFNFSVLINNIMNQGPIGVRIYAYSPNSKIIQKNSYFCGVLIKIL